MIEPSCIAAIGAAMLKDTFPQQSISKFMRLKGQGVTKIFLDGLSWRKYLALVPGLTSKMRCVEIEMSDRLSQHIIIAAVGGDIKFL